MQEKLIDISSQPVACVLDLLLEDKSTNKNIIWATDTYKDICQGFTDKAQMDATELLSRADIIRPRIEKSLEAQAERTRKKAEVFTPSWLCNRMNNYLDEDWFGRKDVFNTENADHTWTATEGNIEIPKDKNWQQYVDLRQMEITCGEAPYLVSRYDVSTGVLIVPPIRRIGMLDRKLRIVNENTNTYEEWLEWTTHAFEASYGYEYQGDSLLIARINLLLTFVDYHEERWGLQPEEKLLRQIANIIAWNVWQMDGLNDTVPLGKPYEENRQLSFLDMFGMEDESDNMPEAVACKIFDWREKASLKFMDLKRTRNMGKKLFDYVIGNPPYQEDTKGAGRQARPIYNLFMSEAKTIANDAVVMIMPSRWFSGGMGLDEFRNEMMNDKHIKEIIDYTNAKDCFENTSISGGVCIVCWNSEFSGDCSFTNITNGKTNTLIRPLNEFPTLVRYNEAVEIIRKIMSKTDVLLNTIISSLMPFGLSTNYRGRDTKRDGDLALYASNDNITYVSKKEINKGLEYIGSYKIMISKTGAEHAGEPSRDGKFGVIPSSMKILKPNEICTHSYFLVGNWQAQNEAENALKYMKTKFVRLLMLLCISGFGLSKLVFNFVPLQDFTSSSDINWSKSIHEIDLQLYLKYGLDEKEIEFIETHIKEMA